MLMLMRAHKMNILLNCFLNKNSKNTKIRKKIKIRRKIEKGNYHENKKINIRKI